MKIKPEDIPSWCLVTEHTISGEKCFLVRPNPSDSDSFTGWDETNLIFRSSVWNSNWELVSAGFFKFFNLGEKPNIHPFNGDITDCSLMEKIDGSCLIVSKFKGSIITRTRGTVDAKLMPNGNEIDIFLKKFENSNLNVKEQDTWDFSYLFEWTSLKNIIIIRYAELDFYYIGCIDHFDYHLMPQEVLDWEAESDKLQTGTIWKRPKRYNFSNLKDLVDTVQTWPGDQEGIVLYYNNNSFMTKIKSLNYLKRHAYKSNCSVKTLTEFYFDWNRPTIEEFKKKVEQTFDYECLKMSENLINLFYTEGIEILNLLEIKAKNYVFANKDLDQKTFALNVLADLSEYSQLPAIAFSIRKEATNLKSLKSLLLLLLKDKNI